LSQAKLNAEFDIAGFLTEDWQKHPRLLPKLVEFHDPLSPEELAGLACEVGVESRLVLGKQDWTLRHGPFQDADFTSLPAENWSLLVQSVDLYISEIKELQRLFTFIPQWRLEDVMVSFASPGGGVGPHFDYYDVFLVQGAGQRRWRLGKKCPSDAQLQADSELALLSSFETEQEVILNPGDVLYIPPQYAHWGEAVSDSLCYSIGFRAPSTADMLEGFSDGLISRSDPAKRFTNKQQDGSVNFAEISVQDLNRAFSLMQEELGDQLSFNKWFGTHMTQPKNPDLFERLEEMPGFLELKAGLTAKQTLLELHPASRLAYANLEEQQTLLFFVDGRVYVLAASNLKIVSQLCESTTSFNEVFIDSESENDLVNIGLDMLFEGSLLLSAT
jgi:50S ribosomal protein L16 3-hydroxylase